VSEFAFDTVSRQSGLGNIALASTGLDATALDGARLAYGAAARMTRRTGIHSALSLHATFRSNERRLIDEFGSEKAIGTYFSESVGRNTSFGVGYNVRASEQQIGSRGAAPALSHDVQAGIEHSWRHARERRSVVSVSVGPSLLMLPALGESPAGNRIMVVGSAALNHDMSRSWNLRTSYRRGSGSIDGLKSDAVSADLHGLLNRRTDLGISLGYSRTDLGFGRPGGHGSYRTSYGSGRLQFALGREVAVYGQYLVYDYNLAAAVPLPDADLRSSLRRGIRIGLTLWAPLYRGAR
jgi:hypothetical protein